MAAAREAKFTTGSTMRHVVEMTLTGALGLSFMFLIDFVTLFWVSQLGEPMFVAAVGFAWTIQFFTISSGIGLMIAATALISRAIGAKEWEAARGHATASMAITLALQGAVALAVLIWRDEILALLGAEGETAAVASRFLLISVPSLPIMAVGMVASAALRAAGDAWRAMAVTMSAGLLALFADPLFMFTETVLARGALVIPFGLGLGVDGAAWVVVLSRSLTAFLGLWWVIRVHDLAGPLSLAGIWRTASPYFRIAAPAMLTQMSTPVGNFVVTYVIAGFGDAAVAGWSVVSRLQILAFGGIFALSGAIGGIIGQNYGAGLIDRVGRAYRDALLFCVLYTVVAWAILASATGLVIREFGVPGEGAEAIRAFTYVAAGGFVFTGALFVANAAFNNLGRPLWSTGFNWSRDFVLMAPFCWVFAAAFGAAGAVYGQAAAGVVVGTAAGITGWRYVRTLTPAAVEPTSAPPAVGTAKAALALTSSPTRRPE
ncbi:MAG: MATE family efflux transporter [Pseudomonadota bacterium]